MEEGKCLAVIRPRAVEEARYLAEIRPRAWWRQRASIPRARIRWLPKVFRPRAWWLPPWLERPLDRWVVRWHGAPPEPHQYLYYRCVGCQRLVSWHGIQRGGCPCHTSPYLTPAELSPWGVVRVVLCPWWGIVR